MSTRQSNPRPPPAKAGGAGRWALGGFFLIFRIQPYLPNKPGKYKVKLSDYSYKSPKSLKGVGYWGTKQQRFGISAEGFRVGGVSV